MQSLDRLLRDIRYAYRALRKCPVLAAAVILILALGIGANTAIFSVLQGVVLAPLPYRDADRLVTVLLYNRALKFVSYLSYPDFLDWQRSPRSFEQMSAFQNQGYDLTSPGEPQHVNGKEVSSGFFGTLGASLALGRDISPEEDHVGGPPVVVITDRLWRGLFSRNPAALGKSVTLSGVDYTIVGVLPPDFHFGDQDADVYTPLAPGDPLYRNDRSVHQIACIARLRPSVPLGDAQAEMNTIQDRIDADNPATERGQRTWLAPLKQSIIGDIGGTLLLLLGAAGLVLLITCSNVANLFLARSAARTREIAIRLALGAGRSQIVRQLTTESVLLSVTGGLLGLVVAQSVLKTVLVIMAGNLPRARNIVLNAPVLLFAFALSVAVGIAFGLMPALRSSATDVHAALKAGSRGTTAGHHRTLSALVILQISLALILLTGGSLLLRTIRNLLVVNPGFDPWHVVTFQIGLSPSVTTATRIKLAYQELATRLRRIPSVQAADISALLPMGQGSNQGPFWVGTRRPASMADIPRAIYYPTGPEYLRAMQIPLLRGRFISGADTTNSELVVVIDSQLARTYFPGRDAIDQILTIPHWGANRNVPFRIVGIVGHVKQYGLDDSVSEKPQIYYSFYQLPDDVVPIFRAEVTSVVRTATDSPALLPGIRAAVSSVGGDQPVYNIHSMQELVSGSMSRQRLMMLLLVGFAALALLLAFVGTYAVIAYSASRRAHEIGIRMALGATKRNILRMVLTQGLRLALAGVVAGAAMALVLTRFVSGFSSLLFGVRADDPLTLIAVSLLLITAALAASYVPACRAASRAPTAAFRDE